MSASIPRLVASAPTADVVAGLDEPGAVIVEGVLAPDSVFDPLTGSMGATPTSQFLANDNPVELCA